MGSNCVCRMVKALRSVLAQLPEVTQGTGDGCGGFVRLPQENRGRCGFEVRLNSENFVDHFALVLSDRIEREATPVRYTADNDNRRTCGNDVRLPYALPSAAAPRGAFPARPSDQRSRHSGLVFRRPRRRGAAGRAFAGENRLARLARKAQRADQDCFPILTPALHPLLSLFPFTRARARQQRTHPCRRSPASAAGRNRTLRRTAPAPAGPPLPQVHPAQSR